MIVRAAIFDVYGTLLRVGPPGADAGARWQRLFWDFFQSSPRLTQLGFTIACQKIVATRHATARAQGIPFPEILWPEVVSEALPEFASLESSEQDEFILRQIQTGHTTELFPGAAHALRELARQGCMLGIASNAQAYTLSELGAALATEDLGLDLFKPDLCFWSFAHGFSKPDPHVFRILTTRLAALGIAPNEAIMVGDRMDNDIEPARVYGWQTWELVSLPRGETGCAGDWRKLADWLDSSPPK